MIGSVKKRTILFLHLAGVTIRIFPVSGSSHRVGRHGTVKMGQYFDVIAPRLRQRVDWGGKLGEILFGGTAAPLVYLFARPIIPPTFTEHCCTPEQKGHGAMTPSATIATTPKKRAHNADRPAGGEGKGTDEKTPTQSAKRSRSSPHLLTLPAEVHLCVLKLLDVADLCNLGLTCCYFWSNVKPEIGKFFAGALGVWAGIPVVCIGDESSTGEGAYPQGLLDEDDKDELKEGLTGGEWEDREDEEWEEDIFSGPATLFRLAENRYRVLRMIENGWFAGHGIRRLWLDHCYRSPCPSDLRDIAEPRPKSFYPSNRVWILRNLTTREFVISNSIALKPEYISGPFIDGIGFGEVILSRICWSTSQVHLNGEQT